MICGGKKLSHWDNKDGYHIYACGDCGHGSVYPRPSVEELTEFYESHQEDVNLKEVSHNQAHDLAFSEVKGKLEPLGITGGNMLDVAAGYGWLSERFHNVGYNVTPLEIAPVFADHMRKTLSVDVIQSSFEDWKPSNDHYGRYDLIIMWQIMEHVLYPDEWFTKAYQLLADGGALVVTTPNFDSVLISLLKSKEGHICPPEHLNFFSVDSIRALSNRTGFKQSHVSCPVEGTDFFQEKLTRRLNSKPLARLTSRVIQSGLRAASLLNKGRYIQGIFIKKESA